MTESEFDHEREALAVIRDMVSEDASAHCWSNVSFQDDRGYSAEIDLLMLNKAGIFVIELKHWVGEVTGRMNDWTRKPHKKSAPQRERNPRVKAELNAKKLKSLLETEREHVGLKRPVPWVDAVLVMHGRGSTFKLEASASPGVFGLDTYGIRGLDTFSSLLKQAPTRQPPLDGPAIKALVKLIEGAGLAPVATTSTDDERIPQPPVTVPSTSLPPVLPERGLPVVQDFFSAVTDHELSALGVPDELIGTLRTIPDQEALIGLIDDELVETIWKVLAGESVAEIIEQCQTAALFEQVDAEHAARGASPAPSPPEAPEAASGITPTPDITKSRPAEAPSFASLDLERLATKFTVRSRKEKPKRAVAAAPSPPSQDDEAAATPAASLIKSEQLLALARSEALQGRMSDARRLIEEVRGHIRRNGVRRWAAEELDALKDRVRDAAMLSIRLESLTPHTPVPRTERQPADAPPVGHLWPAEPLSQAYSLLLREPDILDRRTGLYLSQVIGDAKAAAVNARLRKGRPDGGRIRMTAGGTVVSRRDAESPWFVVGTVAPDEWFTPALTI